MDNRYDNSDQLFAQVTLYDLSVNKVLQKIIQVNNLNSQEVLGVFTLQDELDVSKTWFFDLRLFDNHNSRVSTNFYVLSTGRQPG